MPVLIPGTHEYATLYGKMDSVGVMKLKMLRRGEFPGSSRWAQCNHKISHKRDAGLSELAIGRCYLLALRMEEGAMSP